MKHITFTTLVETNSDSINQELNLRLTFMDLFDNKQTFRASPQFFNAAKLGTQFKVTIESMELPQANFAGRSKPRKK